MDPSQYLASTRIGRGIGTEFAYSGGARRMDDTAVSLSNASHTVHDNPTYQVSAGAPDWMKVNHVVVAESPSMAHADNSSRGFRPSIAERLQDIHGDDASRHRAPNPIGPLGISRRLAIA